MSKLLYPLLLLFVPAIAFANSAAAGELVVENASAAEKDLGSVRRIGEAALRAFERDFGPLPAPIRVVYGAKECLRVGYDFEKKIVQLCATKRVNDAGTNSTDVLRHELFHAMLCARSPDLCTKERLKSTDAAALHEGLADVFAYALDRDALFGEDFYVDQPYVRRYRTPVCYSLVAGEHERGNAVASNLISRKISLRRIARAIPGADDFRYESLLRGMGRSVPACFSNEASRAPEIDYEPANYPKSKLNRFKIDPALPLDLRFVPNASALRAFPGLSIRFVGEGGLASRHFEILADEREPLRFRIRPLGSEIEKVFAEFRAAGKVVGRQVFYLTDAPAPRPTPGTSTSP